MIVRLIAIIYFIRQAKRYANESKESRDSYTILTFLLIGISSICLFIGRAVYMIGSIVILTSDQSDS